MPDEKVFKGFFHLNWKNGNILVRKRKPKINNPYIIPIAFKITVEIPDISDPVPMETKVTLSKTQVKEMFIGNL